jgi:hypothetical protein
LPASAGRQPLAVNGERVVPKEIIDFNNLTCPSCNTGVHLAPFPVFAIREASTAMRAHESGKSVAVTEAADARDVLHDATWGGLFPDIDVYVFALIECYACILTSLSSPRANPDNNIEDAFEAEPEALHAVFDRFDQQREHAERAWELMDEHHAMHHEVEAAAFPYELMDQHDRLRDVLNAAPGAHAVVYVDGGRVIHAF